MKVWIVMGTTGEYSDRSEWPVCVYADEARAQARAEAATQRAAEIYEARPRYSAPPEGANEHDPKMQMDYTGTTYFLAESEMRQ